VGASPAPFAFAPSASAAAASGTARPATAAHAWRRMADTGGSGNDRSGYGGDLRRC
jgi:hypothetical protein